MTFRRFSFRIVTLPFYSAINDLDKAVARQQFEAETVVGMTDVKGGEIGGRPLTAPPEPPEDRPLDSVEIPHLQAPLIRNH
jgi:hypothetical protein